MGNILNRRRVMGGKAANPFIQFADPTTKSLCVALWGGADGGTAPLNTRVNNVKVTGVDGELTYKQAASILTVSNAQFKNSNIGSFDELQYFTELTTIGSESFRSCANMTSIIIPDNVVEIGTSAFDGNRRLSSVIIGNNVQIIGVLAFWSCAFTSITIPNSVTSIGYQAFSDCSSLTSITIPNSVTSIGDYLLMNCRSLTSIVVESGNTFYDSRGNSNAIIETSTSTLIQGCKNTIIPNSVTSIGSRAFYGCSSLTSITIPNSVTSIGTYAFYESGLQGILTIPNSITSISERAFSHCHYITSVAIPNSVTFIGNSAFDGDSGLVSINIPNSVIGIGAGAFWGCSSLTSITIPDSVTSIGNGMFERCTNLASVTVLATTPPTMGSGVFSSTSASLVIYVPAESVEAYKAATNWSAYADKIQAIST